METVNSSKLTDIFKKLLNLLDRGLDQLSKLGIKYKEKDVKDLGNGMKAIRYAFYVGDNDEIVYAIITAKDGSDVCDISIADEKNKHELNEKNVKISKWENYVRKFAEKYYGTDTFSRADDIDSSKKFQIQLQKICTSKGYSVELVKVNCCGVSGDKVMSDINIALDSPEFVDQIQEEPTSFEFIDDGSDSLDVNKIGSDILGTHITFMLRDILLSAYELYNVLKYVQWNSRRLGLDVTGLSFKSYSEMIMSHVDIIQSVSYNDSDFEYIMVAPSDILTEFANNQELYELDNSSIFSYIDNLTNKYIAKLTCYYCQLNMYIDVDMLDDMLNDCQTILEAHRESR